MPCPSFLCADGRPDRRVVQRRDKEGERGGQQAEDAVSSFDVGVYLVEVRGVQPDVSSVHSGDALPGRGALRLVRRSQGEV